MTAAEYKQAEHDLMLVEARRGWRVHALVYSLVNSGLIILNTMLVVFTDATFFWFPFVLVGWGIGLTMHYFFGFRHAEEQIERRQEKIEARAERLHLAA